jgi:predicted nucleic acid-binding protein
LKLETKITLNKINMAEFLKIYEDKPNEAAIKKVVDVLRNRRHFECFYVVKRNKNVSRTMK